MSLLKSYFQSFCCVFFFILSSNLSFACTSFNFTYSFTCAAPGETVTINWTATGCAAGQLVDISLIDVAANATAQYYPNQPNSGSFTLTLGAGLALGTYRFYIATAPWPPSAWHSGPNFELKAAVPIVWHHFMGRQTDDSAIELLWHSLSEQNNLGFEIHHTNSMEGDQWNVIDFIEAEPNSSVEKEYSFLHTRPSRGHNLYKIKQVDINGDFEWSAVILVRLEQNKFVDVYPTLVQHKINVNFKLPSNGSVRVFNQSGLLVKEISIVESSTKYEIDVSDIASSTLFVITEFDNQRVIQKLMKL